jgi:hypothetical protein
MKVERTKLYWIGGIFLAVLIWQFVIAPVGNKLEELDNRIARKEEALGEIKGLQNEYFRFKPGGAVGELAGHTEDFSPLAFLEKLSGDMGIKYEIAYQEPRKLSDEQVESQVTVELNGIDMGQLMNYLYRFENSPEPLRVRNLHLISGKDGFLKVSFEVSTLVPAY